jgi:hypothetical protein
MTTEGEVFYWATMFPGAVDFGHANSIEVWNGDWLLSLKHLDTVLLVDSEDGHVIWWMTGFLDAPEAIFSGPRLSLLSSAGLDPTFQHQHHANPSPWGTPGRGLSRAVERVRLAGRHGARRLCADPRDVRARSDGHPQALAPGVWRGGQLPLLCPRSAHHVRLEPLGCRRTAR